MRAAVDQRHTSPFPMPVEPLLSKGRAMIEPEAEHSTR